MVLLDHVVEIAARPDLHVLPATIFRRQQAQSAVRGAIAIDVDLLRPRHALLADCHAEECLRRLHGAIVAEQRRYRLTAPIHRAIKVVPPAPDRNCRLIHAPGRSRRSREPRPTPFVLGHVAQHPAHDRRVGHDDPLLRHHRDQIAIAQPVGDVPANTLLDSLWREATTQVDRVARGTSWHPVRPPTGTRILGADRQCTRAQIGRQYIPLTEGGRR